MSCKFKLVLSGECRNEADESGFCEEHKSLECKNCKKPATHYCNTRVVEASGKGEYAISELHCGDPLCDECTHREGPVYATHRKKVAGKIKAREVYGQILEWMCPNCNHCYTEVIKSFKDLGFRRSCESCGYSNEWEITLLPESREEVYRTLLECIADPGLDIVDDLPIDIKDWLKIIDDMYSKKQKTWCGSECTEEDYWHCKLCKMMREGV